MMKFTRPITREVEIGGERLAITMGEQGVSFRPVGSRRPPREVSWGTVLCCASGQHPPTEDVASALQTLRSSAGSKSDSASESHPGEHQPQEAATTGEPAHGLQ